MNLRILFRPYLYKNIYIVGSLVLILFFYGCLLFGVTAVVSWVFANEGQYSIDDYSHSTVTLKTQQAIFTNYSESDFNTTYVEPKEFVNYNRVWDRTDFASVSVNQIAFITNLVITANQTKRLCPDNPVIRNVECWPKNNKCRKGFKSSNGIHTGRCVTDDFPINYYHQNNSGYACELIGWCPVDRVLVPLNNYRPVLYETINSTLYIDNSVVFPNYNIIINNLVHKYCNFHPTENRDCPIFKLGDIISFTPNAGQTYEEMAKFGATIDINIEWNCIKHLFSSAINECKPSYSFRRVDVWGNRSQIIYDTKAYYDSTGDKRTFVKSFKIRFQANVKATLKRFDFFHFSVNCLAYAAITWKFICMFYRMFAKYMYPTIELDEIIVVSKADDPYHQIDNETELLVN